MQNSRELVSVAPNKLYEMAAAPLLPTRAGVVSDIRVEQRVGGALRKELQ